MDLLNRRFLLNVLMQDLEDPRIADRVADRLRHHLRAVIDGNEEGSARLAIRLLSAFTNRAACPRALDDSLDSLVDK